MFGVLMVVGCIGCWYQSYENRILITVSNNGGNVLSNYDVSIMLDTKTLVEDSRMRSDCFDVVFTDVNDAKLSNFWLEGGCNSAVTTFWIRSTFPPQSETSFFLYFNNPSIDAAQGLVWSNEFGFFSAIACPSGYQSWTETHDHLIMGFDGEDMTSRGSTTHKHVLAGDTIQTYVSVDSSMPTECDNFNQLEYGTGPEKANTRNHKHDITFLENSTTESHMPKSRGYEMCYHQNGSTQGAIPKNFLAMFSFLDLVSGWSALSNVNYYSEFMMSSSSIGSSQGSIYHSHDVNSVSVSSPLSGAGTRLCHQGSGYAGSSHSHTWAKCSGYYNMEYYGLLEKSNSDISSATLNIRKATAFPTRFVKNMITFQYCGGETCVTPPIGWERYSQLDGRLLQGDKTYPGSNRDATSHRHFIRCLLDQASPVVGCSSGDPNYYDACKYNHNHKTSWYTDYLSVLPKHVKVRFIKRKDNDEVNVNVHEPFTSLCFGKVEPDACHGDLGYCSRLDRCNCSTHQYGKECNITKCDGVFSNDTDVVCNGHGDCIAYNNCSCVSKFYKPEEYCYTHLCSGIPADSPEVCNFHNGTCDSPNNCTCRFGYFGEECQLWTCDNTLKNDSSVCNSHGICALFETCVCHDGYYGDYCPWYDCNSQRFDTEVVCNYRNGTCTAPNNCSCNIGYYGDSCQLWDCNEQLFNDSEVCSKRGVCVKPDFCHCDLNYYFGEGIDEGKWCEWFDCFGKRWDDPLVCNSRNGNCSSFNNCTCNEGYYGENCELWDCSGLRWDDPAVCSFLNGSCDSHNNCTCRKGYYGENCELWNCNGILFNDTINEVCSGRGKCIFPDLCVCDFGYYNGSEVELTDEGYFCQWYDCYGIRYDEDNVCNSRNGSCVSYNNCSCNAGYFGENCHLWECDDILFNDTQVCSGRGECSFPDDCRCDLNYYPGGGQGNWCQDYSCYSIEHDSSAVCNFQNGTCSSHDNCTCDIGYYGDSCQLWECNGLLFDDENSGVCSGRGFCSSPDNCVCQPNYYPGRGFGNWCQWYDCYDIRWDDTDSVCSQNGNCTGHNVCSCDLGYYGVVCDLWNCGNVVMNDSKVCSNGRGVCSDPDSCQCDEFYSGDVCELYNCSGIPHDDPTVCGGENGTCISANNCSCIEGYVGDDCSNWLCYGKINDDVENVCGEHGSCVDVDQCKCVSNYTGDECAEYECYGISWKRTREVCSGHGDCENVNNCSCYSEKYLGVQCEDWKCHGIWHKDVDNVCGAHGSCVDYNQCFCQSAYGSEFVGGPCVKWYCQSFISNDSRGCYDRGTCTAFNLCNCKGGYEGNLCETFRCGMEYTSPSTCSGKGVCVRPNECECNKGYAGTLCEDNSAFLRSILIPIFSVSGSLVGITILVLFLVCCCICCFCTACVLLVFFCSLAVISGSTTVAMVQKRRLSHFNQIDDFDLLLQEHLLEKDASVAHISINKSLFVIDYDTVKVIRMIDEGGSEAVVFLASWQGQQVAFKCFKTRKLCSSQDKFDEFEKEVQMMASLSHPNIIRFFGACLKPPRVGIVMEFCENGEILDFIISQRDNDASIGYPVEEKMRMCLEIASSLEYIHSKSIIHRDLKCGNVLVDALECCKLMDFGLSRVLLGDGAQISKRVGTSCFMAPEVLTGEYDNKSDTFSFGIVMFMMFSENLKPYGADIEEHNIEFRVTDEDRDNNNDNSLFVWVKELIQNCWDANPSKRYSSSELSSILAGEELNKSFGDVVTSSTKSERKKKRRRLIRSKKTSSSSSNNNSKNEEEKEEVWKKERKRFEELLKKKDDKIRLLTKRLAEFENVNNDSGNI